MKLEFAITLILVLIAQSALAAEIKFDDLSALGLDKLTLELGDFKLNLDDVDQGGLKEYYKQYDVDGNGSFDFAEFTIIYQDDEKPFSSETILKHFNEADEDKNGVIDYDELVIFSLAQIPMFQQEQEINNQQNPNSDL